MRAITYADAMALNISHGDAIALNDAHDAEQDAWKTFTGIQVLARCPGTPKELGRRMPLIGILP